LVDGYQSFGNPEEPMTELELYMLNSVGDLEDLNDLLYHGPPQDLPPQSTQEMDCSAFIKVVCLIMVFYH